MQLKPIKKAKHFEGTPRRQKIIELWLYYKGNPGGWEIEADHIESLSKASKQGRRVLDDGRAEAYQVVTYTLGTVTE